MNGTHFVLLLILIAGVFPSAQVCQHRAAVTGTSFPGGGTLARSPWQQQQWLPWQRETDRIPGQECESGERCPEGRGGDVERECP